MHLKINHKATTKQSFYDFYACIILMLPDQFMTLFLICDKVHEDKTAAQDCITGTLSQTPDTLLHNKALRNESITHVKKALFPMSVLYTVNEFQL